MKMMSWRDGSTGQVRCGFCGKKPKEVDVICTSTAAAICNECVMLTAAVMAEWEGLNSDD